jgi:hypothetical protein
MPILAHLIGFVSPETILLRDETIFRLRADIWKQRAAITCTTRTAGSAGNQTASALYVAAKPKEEVVMRNLLLAFAILASITTGYAMAIASSEPAAACRYPGMC